MLYPLKFTPRLKEMIWGGSRLTGAGKKPQKNQNPDKIGESWEISGVDGDVSVVSNGVLRRNNLAELIEVYMGDLVGDKVFDKYGLEFPVLLKFIDSRDKLSVQVHPSDKFAEEHDSSRGKTEMWYIVDADPDGAIYLDFERKTTKEEYLSAVADGTVDRLLHKIEVKKGEAYFVPAGTVHAICSGVLIAEIQETSDVTYRIYDWGRLGKDGRPRQLHTEQAAEVINFTPRTDLDITRRPRAGESAQLVSCEHFTVNLICLDGAIEADYAPLDSFVAYMCVEGEAEIICGGERETVAALESVLIPAQANDVTLKGHAKLLEIFLK